MSVFIQSTEAISPQNTFDKGTFMDEAFTADNEKGYFTSTQINYKEYIAPKLLRRMGKMVRMGIACSSKALSAAGINNPDAIVIGTGLGCLDDTTKFLTQIIENKESLLNPTAFIQSTHNTVSGQIALILGCKGYNFTFTQKEASFETALIDAMAKTNENAIHHVLVGGIDEATDTLYSLLTKSECLDRSWSSEFHFGKSFGKLGEGASFFVLTDQKSDSNLCELKDVRAFCYPNDSIQDEIENFLVQNGLGISDIDHLISGFDGIPGHNSKYKKVISVFNSSDQVVYKHLTGNYDTASGFGLWLGSKIFEYGKVPEQIKTKPTTTRKLNHILVHNYSQDQGHSFMLLSKC